MSLLNNIAEFLYYQLESQAVCTPLEKSTSGCRNHYTELAREVIREIYNSDCPVEVNNPPSWQVTRHCLKLITGDE